MKKLCILLFIVLFIFVERSNAQFGDKPIVQFEITVPAGYNHDTQIDVSKKIAHKEKTVYGYDPCFTSENFSLEKAKLLPGEIFIVKIFSITEMVTSQQCLSFLKNQKAVYFGLHGLTLVFDLKKDALPKDKWIVSFSPKDELFVDVTSSGNHAVPYIYASKDGDYGFEKSYFENDCWIADSRTLLFFVKKE
jgi:hypothetical protein